MTSVLSRVRRDPRLLRVLHGGFSALLCRGIGVLANLITLPLTIRYLGPERYGIWVTISTSVVMLTVLDLGIANSLTNMISRAYAQNDRASAQRFYSTALWINIAFSGSLSMLAIAIWPAIHWDVLFHLANPALTREASRCAGIALAYFLLSLPLNLVNRVLSGYQQTQVTNYFNLFGNACSLIAILSVIYIRGSLVSLMMAYSTALLVGSVSLNVWIHLWSKRWLRPMPRVISSRAARELMDSGMSFFILQLAGVIVFNSDNFVITHYLGATQVVPYSVTWRVASYAAVLQAAVFPSLWPAYSEAYTLSDFVWVRRTFWRTVRLSMTITTIAVVLVCLFGRPLIHWYAGYPAVPSRALLFGICGWTLLSAFMDLQACLLAAINRVRWQGVLSAVAAIVNVCLSVYWVQRIGSLGVVLGTLSSYVLVLLVPQSIIVWRSLYVPHQRSFFTS